MRLLKLLKDETYINRWRWIVSKTQGYRVVITFAVILIIVGLAVVAANRPTWPDWTGLNSKTAWDLASLLIVPLALAVIAFFFNKRQKESELEIAEKERELDREIARDRVQEVALQNYLDKMTELLLPPNNLRESDENSEVRSIARPRTLTVLRSLSGERKGSVLRFLYESGLIDTRNIVIHLQEADLSEAILIRAKLSRTKLNMVNLMGAKLIGSELIKADLRNAFLSEANLSEANLSEADLGEANLSEANLSGTILRGTNLYRAHLIRADLRGAGLNGASLGGADLSGADLRGADLRGAKLSNATYNAATTWPTGFDPESAGAIKVDD